MFFVVVVVVVVIKAILINNDLGIIIDRDHKEMIICGESTSLSHKVALGSSVGQREERILFSFKRPVSSSTSLSKIRLELEEEQFGTNICVSQSRLSHNQQPSKGGTFQAKRNNRLDELPLYLQC